MFQFHLKDGKYLSAKVWNTLKNKATYSFGAALADFMWDKKEQSERCLLSTKLNAGDVRRNASPDKVQKIIGKEILFQIFKIQKQKVS